MSLRDSRDLTVSDPLTGLANRTGLERRVERALKRREPLACCSSTSTVSTGQRRYGHDGGDTVLIDFAQPATPRRPRRQTAARIGGDEFAVVLTDTTVEGRRGRPADPRHRRREPGTPGRRPVPSASASASRSPSPTTPPKELLRRADLAMYQTNAPAPAAHRLRTDDGRSSRCRRRPRPTTSTAPDRDELQVAYQPIVDLTNHRMIAAEALLRWHHPPGSRVTGAIHPHRRTLRRHHPDRL